MDIPPAFFDESLHFLLLRNRPTRKGLIRPTLFMLAGTAEFLLYFGEGSACA